MKKRRTVPSVSRRKGGVPNKLNGENVNNPVADCPTGPVQDTAALPQATRSMRKMPWMRMLIGALFAIDLMLFALVIPEKLAHFGIFLGGLAVTIGVVCACSHLHLVLLMVCGVGLQLADWLTLLGQKVGEASGRLYDLATRLEQWLHSWFS